MTAVSILSRRPSRARWRRQQATQLATVALLCAVAVGSIAWLPSPAAAAWSSAVRYVSPAGRAPLQVVRVFDPPARPWEPGHRGVDLGLRPGSPVHAAGPGAVAFAGTVAGKPVVTVRHSDGLTTTYEPVVASVGVGAPVRAGARLGHVVLAFSHCSSGCLHWGARRGGEYLDPLSLLDLGPARLVPPVGGAGARGDATGLPPARRTEVADAGGRGARSIAPGAMLLGGVAAGALLLARAGRRGGG